ncbi:hypothetical protein [uncultured Muribaculum sp.]|uniref:hypothetical protein n=1 Tax=uncultured Muribaculum sp. TaxID=1918613 RepID=UPI002590216E|nr:hypothetical protein [uncultured Muribaculum sp.]
MKALNLLLSTLLLGSSAISLQAQSHTESDNWAITDQLGRKAREHADAPQKRDKIVAMFYWTWHNLRHNPNVDIKNIPEVLAQHPDAINDYNHAAWGGSRKPDVFFWGQPLFGYYQTTDTWVLRKHAEMLADAGVDVVFFDCTNGTFLWGESFDALCQTWIQAKKDGVNVPKVAFMLPFAPNSSSLSSLRNLYNHVYSANKYRDLWFFLDNKPMIMAWPDNLGTTGTDKAIRDFFTFRRNCGDYVNGAGNAQQAWGWLEVMPTHPFNVTVEGGVEQACVGVAQNARYASGGHCCAFNLPRTYGRSYTSKGWDKRENAYLYGANVQEQWDRAIDKHNPKVVFITGWNEWHSGMWRKEHGWSDPLSFVDQYDWDHSRDIEPVLDWGDNGDVYYVQLVDNVRRFKGMDQPQTVAASKTIKIGQPGQWDKVLPKYKAYKGNVMHRDHDGYGAMHYTDKSGRNDIVGAQVAHDETHIYFRVETASKLTPHTDPAWMQLFIDTDRNKSTGWHGYDYVINRKSPSSTEVVIERNVNGNWTWVTAANAAYKVTDNVLEIAIEKSKLNLGRLVDIEFKWNDNLQKPGNIMDFYISGDTAPGGRFNYVFTSEYDPQQSGIDNVSDNASDLSVRSISGTLQIESSKPFRVYNTSGVEICSRESSDSVPVSTPGIYIVSSGNKTIKVAVN